MEKKKRGKPRKYDASTEESSAWMLHEPEVGYGTGAGMAVPDTFDQINLSRRGVAKSSMYKIADWYGATLDEVSAWMQTSYRNLQRKPDDELLDPSRSEKLMALSILYKRGVEVLGSGAHFREWLRSSILALGNQRPIDLLDTFSGIQHLERILGRLEWGVYS